MKKKVIATRPSSRKKGPIAVIPEAKFKPLAPAVLKKLSKPQTLLSVGFIALDWVSIGAAIYFSQKYWNPFIYILTVMFIGNRQHSLAIQMHDASHSLISKRKWINDSIGEIFCAWPLFFRMAAYRENHMLHHRYSNTDRDPDFRPERFPTNQKQIIRMLVRDALGLGTFDQFKELGRLKKKNVGKHIIAARILYYGTAVALITALGGWKLFALYWAVPIFTWLKVILRVRAIADHAGVQDQAHPFNTRTVIPNLFDRIFIAPRSCSYHLGHHFYATVPSYNLKKLHQELMLNPVIAENARVTRGFINLLKEFPVQEPTSESKLTKPSHAKAS
jgi:fatty acid desaturase